MPLPVIAITVSEQEVPATAPPPVTPDHEAVVVGDLTITNGTLGTAFPLNTPALVPSLAAWTAFGATGGDVSRTVQDIYSRADVPIVVIRTQPRSARGETPYEPTDAHLAAGVAAISTIPTVLNLRPRFLAVPNSYKRQTTGNSGPVQAGDADTDPAAVNSIHSALDAAAESLHSVAVLSCPPAGDGRASTAANMVAWSAVNRGANSRLAHVGNRQIVGGADENEDYSGAVIGAIIAKERAAGVGANMNYRGVTGGVPSPVLSNSYGETVSDDAAVLSAAGVLGIVREQGLHVWGNTFAVADPNPPYHYIQSRRAIDEVIRATRVVNRAVFTEDIGEALFRFIEGHMGEWLSQFQAAGGITGGSIVRDDARNTAAAALAGTVYFTITLELRNPVRRVEFAVEARREAAA